jgi:hypothetical protein
MEYFSCSYYDEGTNTRNCEDQCDSDRMEGCFDYQEMKRKEIYKELDKAGRLAIDIENINPNQWSKQENRDIFYNKAKELIYLGVDYEEVIQILTILYNTIVNETKLNIIDTLNNKAGGTK